MPGDHGFSSQELVMWFAIAVLLFLLWMVGVGLFHVAGNAVHLLAVLAIVSFGLHLARRRRKIV